MAATKVTVRWDKTTLKDLEVDTSEPVELFRTQLWTLTGVPPERQTLIVKGKKLKDEDSWDKIGLRPNSMIMMMGSAAEIPEAPKEKVVFQEDMEADGSEEGENYHMVKRGLANMGNTCYMNSTVQCLNQVNELRGFLKPLKEQNTTSDARIKLGQSLDQLLEKLDPETRNPLSFRPEAFFRVLTQVNPSFGELQQGAVYKQQDAEECWSLILSQLAMALPKSNDGTNPIDRLFGVTMEETCTNAEETGEVIQTTRVDRLLRCHIGNKTSHLYEGLKDGLEEEITRNSQVLGRDALWKQTNRIKKLPPYLGIHFVRFRWKPVERVKAKILRSVSFPFTLDVLELCSEDLQVQLKEKREEARKRRDEEINKITSGKSDQDGDTKMEEKPSEPASTGEAGASESKDVVKEENGGKKEDAGPPLVVDAEIGVYELVAVLTHQGRVAESGHYISYCKDSKDGTWYKFDDDTVTPQKEDDIRKLTGGGDWHIAYMCLYRARNTFD
mmetsp:Transcript_1948/g.5830  ORF Transcript_1948/g.5830 Transcript_1948/m.5830 type:complete len:500 (-) Transcript_1948:245-1744(-)